MTVYLTPTDSSGDAVELSSTMFRKKILPKGKIQYGDREIVFDDEYLTDLAASYKDGAYDQVPYMLADKNNAHTMDPDRFRGECKSVEVEPDGLWGTFELSSDAADLVRKNPKLGVSARIVENYGRSDGKTYKRALQHVLGTLDPRIPGMGAWEEVELSNNDSEVIDLSNFDYEEEGTVSEPNEDAVTVSDEDLFASVQEMLPGWSEEQIRELMEAEVTEEEVAAIDAENAEEAPAEETAAVEEQPKELVAALSNEVVETAAPAATVDLANENLRAEVHALQESVAKERFSKERAEWIRNGVPPHLIKSAEVLLTAPRGTVIDLSNGVEESKVDAAAVVRTILDDCGKYIELAKERGHTLTLSNEENDETAARASQVSAWFALREQNNPR